MAIYNIFKDNKDFSFRDQIQRASVSIMNNISEGFERKGQKEFRHFLYRAKGSAGELRSMLYLAKELKYVSLDNHDFLYKEAEEISKVLSGLIKSVRKT